MAFYLILPPYIKFPAGIDKRKFVKILPVSLRKHLLVHTIGNVQDVTAIKI